MFLINIVAGKYVGNRPIKLRKSNWKERTDLDALSRYKVIFSYNSVGLNFFFILCFWVNIFEL